MALLPGISGTPGDVVEVHAEAPVRDEFAEASARLVDYLAGVHEEIEFLYLPCQWEERYEHLTTALEVYRGLL